MPTMIVGDITTMVITAMRMQLIVNGPPMNAQTANARVIPILTTIIITIPIPMSTTLTQTL